LSFPVATLSLIIDSTEATNVAATANFLHDPLFFDRRRLMQTEKAPITTADCLAQASIETTAWFEILHLKQVFRKGWLERGIAPARCETVAEHTFGNAMLCLLLAQSRSDLNLEQVLRLALIHDLGEVYVGDITPNDGVDRQQKISMERAAVVKILEPLANGAALISAWDEYESQTTPEARFVKEIDRLEFALQAAQYQAAELIDGEDLINNVGKQLRDQATLAPFSHLFRASPN